MRSKMRFAPTASAASIQQDQPGISWFDTAKLTVWKRIIVVVQKFFAIERLEALQDPVSDPTCTDGTDNFALEVKGVPGDVSNFPIAALDHLVSG